MNSMINHKFANCPLKTLLFHCNKSQQKSIANCVHNQVTNLYYFSNSSRQCQYGREFFNEM